MSWKFIPQCYGHHNQPCEDKSFVSNNLDITGKELRELICRQWNDRFLPRNIEIVVVMSEIFEDHVGLRKHAEKCGVKVDENEENVTIVMFSLEDDFSPEEYVNIRSIFGRETRTFKVQRNTKHPDLVVIVKKEHGIDEDSDIWMICGRIGIPKGREVLMSETQTVDVLLRDSTSSSSSSGELLMMGVCLVPNGFQTTTWRNKNKNTSLRLIPQCYGHQSVPCKEKSFVCTNLEITGREVKELICRQWRNMFLPRNIELMFVFGKAFEDDLSWLKLAEEVGEIKTVGENHGEYVTVVMFALEEGLKESVYPSDMVVFNVFWGQVYGIESRAKRFRLCKSDTLEELRRRVGKVWPNVCLELLYEDEVVTQLSQTVREFIEHYKPELKFDIPIVVSAKIYGS